MTTSGSRRGFSLVETVIAVAVLAVSVAGVLALLPVVTRQMSEGSEALVAHGMSGAIEIALSEIAQRDGWAALASTLPTAGSAGALTLVANKQGERISATKTATLAAAEQFFLIELWKIDAAEFGGAMPPGNLTVQVRVAWPYRVRAGDGESMETKPQLRASAHYTVTVRR